MMQISGCSEKLICMNSLGEFMREARINVELWRMQIILHCLYHIYTIY